MPKMKEFTVTIADKPGALGKCFLALAEHGVNILAYQSYVEEGESLARFLADDAAIAKSLADMLRAARQVISNNQTRINDPNLGEKGLSGQVVLQQ